MAIVNNISTEYGDVIRIKSNVPIIGIISLISFIDATIGEDQTKSFQKMFRYSLNGGMTFSNWLDLTTINVQNLKITKYDNFVIDYTYSHIGIDGNLQFDSLTLNGSFEGSKYPHFDNSFFSEYQNVDSICTLQWAINVLEKIYKLGLLPEYVERGLIGNVDNDKDFVTFWYSLTHFFAIIVCFARKFEDIKGNELFLEKYIKSKGLFIQHDISIEKLIYLYENYITEFSKRGTLKIIETEAEGNEIDGELLRLINKTITDEFIFALCKPHEIGWNVGNSSPMYKNTNTVFESTKGYEKTYEVIDIANYPIINNGNITVNNGYLQIDTYSGISGIGQDTAFKILIDPRLNYEICFRVKQSNVSDSISFGVDGFKANGDSISFEIENVYDGGSIGGDLLDDSDDSTWFFENKSMQIINKEYWIRAIIFNYEQTSGAYGQPLNIGIGNNLIFKEQCKYIIPKVLTTNNIDTISITDFKVRPLNLDFSKGFLGARNFIVNWFINNNSNYSNDKIVELIKRYLLPYNAIYKEIIIN